MRQLTIEHVNARYHSPMQPNQARESFLALQREQIVQEFLTRTGLKRDQVGFVCNSRTNRAYVQWIHATPNGLRTEAV